MNLHAIFLRGVNVGGVKILMKDLALMLEDAGFSPVKTLLASGNVVLGSAGLDACALKERIEQVLETRYGRVIPVIVMDTGELERIAAEYPFIAPDDGIARHRYLVLTGSHQDAATVFEQAPGPGEFERVERMGNCICWEVPRGESLVTELAKHFAKVASKTLVTTRNMNTIEKVLDAMRTNAR
ncbi:DUF1697 domain-containing protein [Paeniglutamicibacter antarcticus]|uniref:DUF1697 domain-containing protein n=1 Tax=Paeniglutamicibacter antarcticus TaxID=494023 RepID=A0ABP9TIE1_9MICC